MAHTPREITQKASEPVARPEQKPLSSEEKLLRAIFGKSADETPELEPMTDVWEEAQAQVTRGEATSLKPRELARWASRFSAEEIDALVIPKRTLARRRANRELLTLDETDKAMRLARISAEADRVFGDPAKASRWLRKPNSVFAGQTPLALLKSETGARAVDELLGQIDHGMFV